MTANYIWKMLNSHQTTGYFFPYDNWSHLHWRKKTTT